MISDFESMVGRFYPERTFQSGDLQILLFIFCACSDSLDVQLGGKRHLLYFFYM